MLINAGPQIDAGGEAWRFVHAFCDEVTIEVTMAQKRKKSYDISFKLKAVESAEKKSKEAAAREFCVDDSTIRSACSK